jgi:hypothetical protein
VSGVSPVLVEWFHGLAWGCWCGRDHGLGCPVGMSGSGMGMLLGSRTATPRVIVARFDAHAWRPVLGGWSDRVARGGLRTG